MGSGPTRLTSQRSIEAIFGPKSMKVHYSSPPCEGRDSGPASTMMQRGVRPGCEVINDLPSVYTGSWAEKKMVFLLDSFPPLTFWENGEQERETAKLIVFGLIVSGVGRERQVRT